ncbi:MAG: ABC transporter permease [Planctomycetes bacterium]|nr:ABC transporter permease [Planctomycetota bacterium]MBL7106077.1 ABC transporter permease [Phycisphaerae bacterium]
MQAAVEKNERFNFEGYACEFAKIFAFIKKDFKIAVSYKLQFCFQFLQIFFSVTVIFFIGRMLGYSDDSMIFRKYGCDYFSFAFVGLAVNSYLKAGLVNMTNDIRQTMNQGILEAMFATPTGYWWLLMCSSIWQFIFETFRVTCYFLVAIFIFNLELSNANWSSALLILLLTVPVFLMLGLISCSILVVVKRGDPINWIFSSAGAILAGTMFPVSVLPLWLQKVSVFLPLTHSLEALRLCIFKNAAFSQVADHAFYLFLFMIFLAPSAFFINKYCMKIAKKKGAFSTF